MTPAALRELDPALGADLLAAGVPAWRAVGRALAGRRYEADLLYDAAPYGVGYFVAIWVAAVSRLVALVGPTATGKTALAVELAGRLGAEVVNADSMQLYRGHGRRHREADRRPSGGACRTTCSTSGT